MSFTPQLARFYTEDKERLTKHLARLEEKIVSLIQMVNYGEIKFNGRTVSFRLWVCENCDHRIRWNGENPNIPPQKCDKCEKGSTFSETVDIFDDFAEPYFYGLLSEANMYSIGLTSGDLQWKEQLVKTMPAETPVASETPSPAEKTEGALKRFRNWLLGPPSSKTEETPFKTALEEKTETIAKLYHDARVLIKYQGEPRARERLSKIRKEVTELGKLFSETVKTIQRELNLVNVAVAQVSG